MGIAERRARAKDELRQKILAAAVELFVENGYESVTMRGIADRIEYSPATIYLHFRNKTELTNAICADTFETLIERLDALEERNLPPLEAFLAGLRCYIAFGLEHPRQYQLVFGAPTPDDCGQDPATNQLGMQALEYLGRCLVRCRESGLFAPGDTIGDAIAIWMQLHGVTTILINDHGRYDMPWPSKEALIERSLELIVLGLRA
ncbi:MAG TPA: TetR/AcrR family transcriptional regulator [Bryobacteraceae bacterium]|nr:TetR/AcrR family transcriptional regulator [Bryobacteraceae bacterium]